MVSAYAVNSPSTVVVALEHVSSQRHEEVLRAYPLPVAPKTQWIVRNVVLKLSQMLNCAMVLFS